MRNLYKLKAMHRIAGIIAIVAVIGFSMAGCDNGTNPDPGTQGVAPTVTTASLPNGTVGTAYSQTLTATGDAPITWSIGTGTLPDGFFPVFDAFPLEINSQK